MEETKKWRARVQSNMRKIALQDVANLKEIAEDETVERKRRKEVTRKVIEIIFNFYTGDDGFEMDVDASNAEKLKFLQLGMKLQVPTAFQYMSVAHLGRGKMVPTNKLMSAFYLGRAVSMGYHAAHAQFGLAVADGLNGYPKDRESAHYHLTAAKRGWPVDSCQDTLARVEEKLQQLHAEQRLD